MEYALEYGSHICKLLLYPVVEDLKNKDKIGWVKILKNDYAICQICQSLPQPEFYATYMVRTYIHVAATKTMYLDNNYNYYHRRC